MKDQNRHKTSTLTRNQARWKHLVSVILWTVLFTLAYSQAPLYTSNQNQYFLHGYAQAGFGFLDQDWLANTLDPTPVFSGLIHLTAQYLAWPPIFYGYFAILAGIYLFSLYGILTEAFQCKNVPNSKRWFYLTVLFLVHSAAIRYLIIRISNPNWAFLLDGGVAGQRLLGEVFQPSTFGVFLILSIYLFLRGNTFWAVLSLVLAPTFHPTYLFSAAILTLIYMGISFYEHKKLGSTVAIGFTALVGVLPCLILAFNTFSGSDPQTTARSREILVTFRIPHHAIPTQWLDGSVIIKVAFILLALYLTRKSRIFHLVLWPFLSAVLGTILQLLTDSAALALLFPWRVSTWLVPVAVGIILFKGLDKIWPWLTKRISASAIKAACMAVVVVLAALGLYKTLLNVNEKNNSNAHPMLKFVKDHKSPEDVYLIPLDMQDFRLETGASAYVEFKSIPYRDSDVLEWYRRIRLAGNLYRAPIKRTGCQILSELFREGVNHVVLPYDHTVKNCSNLNIQYVDLNYQVYQLTGD